MRKTKTIGTAILTTLMVISMAFPALADEPSKTIENGETAGYWAIKPGSTQDWIYVRSGGTADNYDDWVKNSWILYKGAWYFVETDGEMYDPGDDNGVKGIDDIDYVFNKDGVLIGRDS